jgi:putative glutamine amidotransferase
MRPVIGITSYRDRAVWGSWDADAVVIPDAYVRKIQQAGAHAVVIPPNGEVSAELLDRLDGLLLAGGADIDPAHYAAEAHEQTRGLRPDRDASELALCAAALDRDLPTLGICRGMQVMAVISGGSLIQHLPEVLGHEGHRPRLGSFGQHAVDIVPGSRLSEILGEHAEVSSAHHQGVGDPGKLEVSAHAHDGIIEAIEDPARRFALGVLWHPEARDDSRLFDALVAAART